MFEKDVLYGGERLDATFEQDEPFILYGVTVLDTPVPTSVGDATKTILQCAKRDAPDDRLEVVTLASAIAEKAADAEPGDFPALVRWTKVEGRYDSDATVLQLIAPYDALKEANPL